MPQCPIPGDATAGRRKKFTKKKLLNVVISLLQNLDVRAEKSGLVD